MLTSAPNLQEKQYRVNGCCSKAHMLQVSRELLLELQGLQQLIHTGHSAEKNSHPVNCFQMLDVTLPPVTWMSTLQINTAYSLTFHTQPSLGLKLFVCGWNKRCTPHLTQLTLQNWLIATLSASSGSNFCNAHSCSSSRSTPCTSLSCTSH